MHGLDIWSLASLMSFSRPLDAVLRDTSRTHLELESKLRLVWVCRSPVLGPGLTCGTWFPRLLGYVELHRTGHTGMAVQGRPLAWG